MHFAVSKSKLGSLRATALGPKPTAGPSRQTKLVKTLRPLPAVAAARRDEDEPIDVEATAAAPTSRPSTSRTGAGLSSGIDDARRDAEGAVDNAASTANAALGQAAETAQGFVSDASDVASALVDDAAEVANRAVSRIRDVDQTARETLQEVDQTARSVVNDLSGQPAPIDWQSVQGQKDPRFAGLKVLVVGATGGVGRRVVQALRAKGVACRALVRDRSRAADLLPPPTSSTAAAVASQGADASTPVVPEFSIVTGDVYQYATLPSAIQGCNAIVVASAANDKADPFGPFNIDYQGTLNLIAAAKRADVKRFVYVTSIGADDPFNPLNLFWGILFWKKRAEEELQRSGLTYTIVRPGGLKDYLSSNERSGNIVMEGPNTFGFPPLKRSGAILRSQVADVCVEALVSPAAADKVVEIVAEKTAPVRTVEQLFEGVVV